MNSEVHEFLLRALDQSDPNVRFVNDASELILLIGEAASFLQSLIEDIPDSPFNEENSKKIMKHLVKAGDLVLAVEEPRYEATVEITMKQIEDHFS